MAGGTWIDQNKVRPGVYINYKSSPASLSTMGERGVVAIARVMDWGEQGRFYTINDPSDCAQLGHSITDDEMLFLRQILLGSNRTNGATKVLLWSLAQSTTSGGGVGGGGSGEPIQRIAGLHVATDQVVDNDYYAVVDSNESVTFAVEGADYYIVPETVGCVFVVKHEIEGDDTSPLILCVPSALYDAGIYEEVFEIYAYSSSRVVGTRSGCVISGNPASDTGIMLEDGEGNLVGPIEGAENYQPFVYNDTEYYIVKSTYESELDGDLVSRDCLAILDPPVDFSGTLDAVGLAPEGSEPVSSGAAKATATIGNLVATAKYYGTYGNRLSVVVTAGTSGTFIVQTLLDGQVADTQIVSAISGLVPNDYIVWSGTGALAANDGVSLTGGAIGDPTLSSYSDFLSALENQKFDVVIYDGTDATTQSAYVGFVKRLSNQEGIKCQAVISNAASAPDNECVINVYPHAVTLTDGKELQPSELTWWVGGASAGANVFESLTYASYPDAASINPVLTSAQQEEAINAGKFALIAQFDKIQVLTDINSFTTFAVEKGKAFRKNRVIRTIFGLCNDIYKTFALYYIGAVHNDDDGRNSLKAEILNLMNKYQGNRALQNVEANDVTVMKGTDSDAVVIEIYCQPVDSIEKIYINITIS